MQHWFDGFSMNHKFEMTPNSVQYSSRFASDALKEEVERTGNLERHVSFAQSRDPCDGLFRKLKTTLVMPKQSTSPSGANVNVTISKTSDGNMMVRTDANQQQVIDSKTLEPVFLSTYADVHPELKGQLSAAHGETDEATGEYFNFCLDFVSSTYTVFKETAGKATILAKIKGERLTYIHSMWLTPNYVVLGIWQAFISNKGLGILWNRNVLSAISQEWDNDAHTRFVVVDRKLGGVVKTFEAAEAFFCFHTINAFEEERDLVLDLCQYKDNSILTSLYVKYLNTSSDHVIPGDRREQATFARYRLPEVTENTVNGTKVFTAMRISTRETPNIELPIINPHFAQKSYRFVYGINTKDAPLGDRIVKIDNKTGESLIWKDEETASPNPGEPIFVPNPVGTAEDDGVLLTVVLDGESGKSSLVILNAQSMKVVARAKMQTAVPLGFHGTFVK